MSVDKQTVAKIAGLARIKMGDEELERMVPELNNILDWVEQLGEVDVSGVEPMTAVIPNTLRLREDVVDADPLTGGGKRDAVIANAIPSRTAIVMTGTTDPITSLPSKVAKLRLIISIRPPANAAAPAATRRPNGIRPRCKYQRNPAIRFNVPVIACSERPTTPPMTGR